MAYGIIYKAEFPNGKMYVGSTILPLNVRADLHVRAALSSEKGCIAFNRAIRKYGKPEFKKVCAAESKEELDEMEVYWISNLESKVPNGYNIKEGGSNGKHSEETKKKMSKTRTGRKMPPRTPEQCLKYARRGQQNPNFGKERSPEVRKKIGDAQRGEKNHRFGTTWDEDHLIMFREMRLDDKNHFYGKQHNNKTKDKMSNRKRKLSDLDVIDIKKLYYGGNLTQSDIAKDYGVNPTTINRAINGKRRCYAKGVQCNA